MLQLPLWARFCPSPEFELTENGYYVARQTQHQVILSPNPAVEGAGGSDLPDERLVLITGIQIWSGSTSIVVCETPFLELGSAHQGRRD